MTRTARRLALTVLVAGTIAACGAGAASPASSPVASGSVAPTSLAAPSPSAAATVASAAPSLAARASAAAVAAAVPGCVSAETLKLLTTAQSAGDQDVAIAFVKANKEALINGLKAYKPAKADDTYADKDHIYSDDIVYQLQQGRFEEATRLIRNASGKWTYPVVCKA